jgi:hypothetical protein
VEQQLRAKRKEARLAVLSRADADAAAAAAGTLAGSDASLEALLDSELAHDEGPPLPRHTEARHPGAVPGARVEHIMELWNFLQVCDAACAIMLVVLAV